MTLEGSKLVRIALELWADVERRTELPVQGFSMWPVLRSEERILVRHGGVPPKIGQVIVVLDGQRVLAHRVIQLRRKGRQILLRTKGDTCLAPDPGWFETTRIVGVVEGVLTGDAIKSRLGLDGWWARILARLSRSQGFLCSPLYAVGIRLRSRRD